jgi:hypothetical protein
VFAGPTATGTDADANAKTITQMSEPEHIFYLLCVIPMNDEWKFFLELMMDKHTTMTTVPDELVTKLVLKKAALKREDALAPEALLVARQGDKVMVMAVKRVKAAEVQRGIREIIRETSIGKRRISGSAFIASGEGTPPRTARATKAVSLQCLQTLQQKHRLRLLRSRTSGWWLAQMLHAVIGSSIADARLISPAADQYSSRPLNNLRIQST